MVPANLSNDPSIKQQEVRPPSRTTKIPSRLNDVHQKPEILFMSLLTLYAIVFSLWNLPSYVMLFLYVRRMRKCKLWKKKWNTALSLYLAGLLFLGVMELPRLIVSYKKKLEFI